MSKASILTQRIVPGGVILLLTALLWLPFGFEIGPWGDDWFFFLNAERGISWGVALRPLLPLPHVLGAVLTPGSFVGSNLVLAGLIAARSLAVYGILRRLRCERGVALLAAALTLALPIDTGVFYRGALTVYVSGLAYLLAVYCLLAALDQPRLRWYMGMWVALIVCVGSYEANYGLIAATPALLWLTRPRFDRRWRALTLRWCLFPALWLIYYGVTLVTQPSTADYQTSLRASLAPLDVLNALGFIYARHFVTFWSDLFTPPFTATYAAIALGAGGLAGVGVLLLRRSDSSHADAPSLSRRMLTPGMLLLLGLVVIGLGVMVYLPTTLRTDTLRTYFVTTAGAALALTAAASLLARWVRWRGLPVLLTLTFVPAGMYGLLQQQAANDRLSEQQQTVLVTFARHLPQVTPSTGILVIDETNDELERLFGFPWWFALPFMILYDDPELAAMYCLSSELAQPDAPCQFTAAGLQADLTEAIRWERPYDAVIVVTYDGTAFSVVDDLTPYAGAFPTAERYNPDALFDPTAPLPDRACTLFTVNACP